MSRSENMSHGGTRNYYSKHCFLDMLLEQSISTFLVKKKMKNGVEQYHIVYPKLMNGEAVVRNVPTKQNFGKLNFKNSYIY